LLHKSIAKTTWPNNSGSGTSWLVALPKNFYKKKIPPFSFQSTKPHWGSIPKGVMNKNQDINTTFTFKVLVNSRNKWSLMLIATPTSNCNTLSSKTTFQWKRKVKSIYHHSINCIFHVLRKLMCKPYKYKFKTHKTITCFSCVLWNFKRWKMIKPHHGVKPPNTKKRKSLSICTKI